jgi:hypothetical protein
MSAIRGISFCSLRTGAKNKKRRCAPGDSNCTRGDSKCALGDFKRTPGDSKCAPGNSNRTPGDSKCAPGNSNCTPGDSKCAPLAVMPYRHDTRLTLTPQFTVTAVHAAVCDPPRSRTGGGGGVAVGRKD